MTRFLALFVVGCLGFSNVVSDHLYADQLYEDLLYYYNKNVRPVKNASDVLTVKFGASLIRIISVDEVSQVLTTNLWLEMQWMDNKLKWDPEKNNNIQKLHVPSDLIWTPDILLYNNADGEPHITIMSDALVDYTGAVIWKPPSIYKSFCEIDIEYFPFDQQRCYLKFGGWTHNGFFLDMEQIPVNSESRVETKYKDGIEYQYLEQGMDLSYYYENHAWDLINLTSAKNQVLYPGCCGQEFYIDITFHMTIRRKTLFYTVNLVIPCMLIAILTTFVFYIPAGDHKITMSISILVALTVFYLVLIELIPPTSLVIPLIGKYLLFTMFLVSVSIIVSVVTLNLYHRNGATHTMPKWMKFVFVKMLPKPLGIKQHGVYENEDSVTDDISSSTMSMSDLPEWAHLKDQRKPSPYFMSVTQYMDAQMRLTQLAQLRGMHADLIRRMIDNVSFIADHFRALEDQERVSEEWSYVAMVIDRLFLIVFTVVNFTGTILIILQSPALFDSRLPLPITGPTKPLGAE